jgi:hypothetical protein
MQFTLKHEFVYLESLRNTLSDERFGGLCQGYVMHI